jgi:DNA-binding transcriptional LysR family regulator
VAQRSPDRWWFMEGKKKFAVNVRGNLVADDWAVILEAVLAGLGLARVFDLSPPRFVPHRDLEALFANSVVPDRALWALVPSAKPMPRKIRVSLDFLTKSLRKN